MPKPKQEELPKDWQPTQAVDDPIINSAYEEPRQHWLYNKAGVPEKQNWRRPASYWFKTHRVGRQERDLLEEIEREENRDDLPLVNALREDVKRWRESGYRGASHVTKELLQYWMREDRTRPLFFCQREAVETIIYVLELAVPNRLGATQFKNFQVDSGNFKKLLAGKLPDFEDLETTDFFPRLIDPSADDDLLPLRRLGCKMATGSGKTIVMAMLITWAFCNRGRNPASKQYPNAILVCAPNLTVRKRLEVLRPEDVDNYYDAFDIIPSRYREYLNGGKVLVTNWHKFAPKSEHNEGGTAYRVVDKGEESFDAFAKDRLGDLVSRLPILVLNDEGHHCWRPKPAKSEAEEKEIEAAKKETEEALEISKDEKDARKEDIEEARVWLMGLDKLNNSGLLGSDEEGKPVPGILTCVDMSATPFYLSNSGYPEGSPFPWLVSDFGLVDAIECGITKVPRLPVADDSKKKDEVGRPDPQFFRLWEHIKNTCTATEKIRGTPKPDAVWKYAQPALTTLASQWKIQFEKYEEDSGGRSFIPPVMIVVCDNTDTAQIVYEHLSGETEVEIPDPDKPDKTIKQTKYGGGKVFPDLLGNTETSQVTVRIDSKLLEKVEKEEGESKDEAALRLREIIDTVGKRGGLGEQIRCVVSVSMLTEGWDANNVTHILGIRAFGSQLLCEQVVGRGLRRMSYTPDPDTGLLPAEYADVYGIPFSLIPYKGQPKDTPPKPDPVYHSIYAMEERADYEIRMPNVESYVYELRDQGIKCDVDSLEKMVIDKAPAKVWLMPTRGVNDSYVSSHDASQYVEQTREEYYKSVRPQQLTFRFAELVLDDLLEGVSESDDRARAELKLRARHQLFPEIVGIVQQYIKKKVEFKDGLDPRELGLEIYAKQIVERIRDNILPSAAEQGKLIPIINRFQPYSSTADVNYPTTRPVVPLTKSHLNLAMVQSGAETGGFEVGAIEILEELDCVDFYTPNDRGVGLVVPYDYDGETKSYEPDFIVRLRGSKTIMLEIKGGGGKVHDENKVYAKNAAAKKWCDAVSNLGTYGIWAYEICEDNSQLRKMLTEHAGATDSLPFVFVDRDAAKIWEDAVPLVNIRTLMMNDDYQQTLDGGIWDKELVTWDGHPEFGEGMFVARVLGDAMEPAVKAGSYCLFRKAGDVLPAGEIMLVRHPKINDPHSGGDWTVRKATFTGAVAETDSWKHGQIKLEAEALTESTIIIDLADSSDIKVFGEFVDVIS